jgi:putative oxidoreductase
MTTAIAKVHRPNGPWVHQGGWEYNAVLIASVISLAETGPGDLSLDHAFGLERAGWGWALAALGAGVGAAALTMTAGARGTDDSTSPAHDATPSNTTSTDTASVTTSPGT